MDVNSLDDNDLRYPTVEQVRGYVARIISTIDATPAIEVPRRVPKLAEILSPTFGQQGLKLTEAQVAEAHRIAEEFRNEGAFEDEDEPPPAEVFP